MGRGELGIDRILSISWILFLEKKEAKHLSKNADKEEGTGRLEENANI